MNRTKVNYWIDVGLTFSFLACFFTGIIKWPGLIRLIGASLYAKIPMHNISTLHIWSGLIMGILVFIHQALHWNWITTVTKGFFKKEV